MKLTCIKAPKTSSCSFMVQHATPMVLVASHRPVWPGISRKVLDAVHIMVRCDWEAGVLWSISKDKFVFTHCFKRSERSASEFIVGCTMLHVETVLNLVNVFIC